MGTQSDSTLNENIVRGANRVVLMWSGTATQFHQIQYNQYFTTYFHPHKDRNSFKQS